MHVLGETRLEAIVGAATAVSAQPNGAAYYNYRIRQMTTTAKSAEEIHQLGLSEVKRIRAEMDGVMREAGWTRSFPEFLDLLGEGVVDPAGAQAAAEEYLASIKEIEANYARHAKAAREIAAEYFDSDKVLTRLLEDALNSK